MDPTWLSSFLRKDTLFMVCEWGFQLAPDPHIVLLTPRLPPTVFVLAAHLSSIFSIFVEIQMKVSSYPSCPVDKEVEADVIPASSQGNPS